MISEKGLEDVSQKAPIINRTWIIVLTVFFVIVVAASFLKIVDSMNSTGKVMAPGKSPASSSSVVVS